MCRPKFYRIVGDIRYQVSNEFKTDCKANIGQYEKIGTIHVVEDDIDIKHSDNLVDFSIEDNCYINDKFIGTTVAKKITVNILNPDNEINLENKEITATTGMIINGVEETVSFGNFIIEKPDNEEAKEKTSFTGYDYMIKFNTLYQDRVTYPCKTSALFEDICNQAGLEVGNMDFPNADYMILGNPFTNNEDCRTVLSNIAQLAGGFAKIGRDNKVYIITLAKDTLLETIDGNNYFTDYSKNNEWGEVNSVVLGLSSIEGENTALDDKDSIDENGLTEIVINDNYFLIDQAEREKVIEPLWNSLKGLKYLPFKTEYYGYPYLDSGDMIKILDSKDNEYTSYVFNHTFKFNGGYSGKIETTALTKTQTAYKNTVDTKTKFRQVERKIDKINGTIEDVIEEQTGTSEKLTQHEQDINSIKQQVSDIADYKRTAEGISEVHLLEAGAIDILQLEVKGNKTYENYLYPSEDLYPSESLYPNMEGSELL